MLRPEYKIALTALFFTCVYLLLPSANSSSDAIGYAADVRWNMDLLSPHHLLYNVMGRGIYLAVISVIPDTGALQILQAMNAVLAGIALLFTGMLLLKKGKQDWILPVMVLMASSYGLMRYATENETYIAPLAFAMAAWYWLVAERYGSLPLAAASAAIAMLLHQTYFFWWMALLVHCVKAKRYMALGVVAAGIIPVIVVYAWAAGHVDMPLSSYVLHDLNQGAVNTGISLKNFIMTPISLLRSFVQVHGYQVWIWNHGNLLQIGWMLFSVLMVVAAAVFALLGIAREMLRLFAEYTFYGVALLLFLLFAFWSEGNAEFMVPVPVLLFLFIGENGIGQSGRWLLLGMAMFVWNITLGLIPWNQQSFYRHGYVMNEFMDARDDDVLLCHEPVMLQNLAYYHTNQKFYGKFVGAPEWQAGKGVNLDSFLLELDKKVLNPGLGNVYYSDYCSYLLNRAALTSSEVSSWKAKYFFEKSGEVRNMGGVFPIYRLRPGFKVDSNQVYP